MTDQADIRTFGSLYRTDAPVVAVMDITDFESGALTRQTARTHG